MKVQFARKQNGLTKPVYNLAATVIGGPVGPGGGSPPYNGYAYGPRSSEISLDKDGNIRTVTIIREYAKGNNATGSVVGKPLLFKFN